MHSRVLKRLTVYWLIFSDKERVTPYMHSDVDKLQSPSITFLLIIPSIMLLGGTFGLAFLSGFYPFPGKCPERIPMIFAIMSCAFYEPF